MKFVCIINQKKAVSREAMENAQENQEIR